MLELQSGTRLAQLFRFSVVGLAGALSYFGVGWFLAEVMGLQKTLAATLAFCLVVAQNYVWHHKWTFSSSTRHIVSGPRFIVATIVGLLTNATVVQLLTSAFDAPILAAQFVAMLFVIASNLALYFVWVFRQDS